MGAAVIATATLLTDAATSGRLPAEALAGAVSYVGVLAALRVNVPSELRIALPEVLGCWRRKKEVSQ